MKIGDLAERADVGVQTVRYYERRELLPEPDRTGSGYREYDEHDLRRLRFILRRRNSASRCRRSASCSTSASPPTPRRTTCGGGRSRRSRQRSRRSGTCSGIRAALERLVSACDAHGKPEECALMHAIGADEDF